MMSSPRSCREGCGQPAVKDGYCKNHQDAAARTFKRIRDEIDKMYGRVRWFHFRGWILSGRPICQRINKGVRCNHASTLVHHLHSPRVRPDLFTSERNVLALCAKCHGPEDGTPWYRAGVDFVDEPLHGSWENYGARPSHSTVSMERSKQD